nr:MAG TPA: hypothetical protein [Caudoviricetes sp.]DAL47098.1 MAG TPA_asm: hypothetical protein [Bacteriophage sp.]DAZ39644.1 MAG TPA: hypothetical protein [Caudoviricetes sp.]
MFYFFIHGSSSILFYISTYFDIFFILDLL